MDDKEAIEAQRDLLREHRRRLAADINRFRLQGA
jgi:hypothetical protein